MSRQKKRSAQCPDCRVPMTRSERGVTCPKCGWTAVYGNHGTWFVGWYSEKADKVRLEQFWKATLLPASSGSEV